MLRGAATTIRYEASFMFCILFLTIIYFTFNISRFYIHKDVLNLIILPMIFIRIISELHRTPFDFSERERELVRGYNTEYGGKNFAFLFLGEYSILLFNRMLVRVLFLGVNHILIVSIATLLIRILFINIRITLCRHRYDLLIMFN